MKLEDYIVRNGWTAYNRHATRRCNSLEEYARKNMDRKYTLNVTKPWIAGIFQFMKAVNKPCTAKEIAAASGSPIKCVYQAVAEMIRFNYRVTKVPDGRFIRYQLVL